MSTTAQNCICAALLALCLGILAFISNDLYDHTSQEEQTYCEMVDAWLDSDGEFGWPDYNDNFDEVCTNE